MSINFENIIDKNIFTKTIIKNQDYNISGVADPSSKILSEFFFYYFKNYSYNRLGKSSDVDVWVFVAHKDDKIIGAIKGDIMWNVIHIDLLMIHPDYRKLGIGSELYNLAIQFGKKQNCKIATVETFDFQAPAYWENKGFKLDFKRTGYEENTLYFYSKSIE